MCLTCDLTVPSEMIRRAAMPALVWPVAMSRRTSISRRVNPESAGEWSATNVAANPDAPSLPRLRAHGNVEALESVLGEATQDYDMTAEHDVVADLGPANPAGHAEVDVVADAGLRRSDGREEVDVQLLAAGCERMPVPEAPQPHTAEPGNEDEALGHRLEADDAQRVGGERGR